MASAARPVDLGVRAQSVRASLPPGGLFADLNWRIAAEPLALEPEISKEIDSLGRVLVQFYRAANLLYRRSVEGKAEPWIAQWLDLGKPADLIALQRDPAFKAEIPRVIRPDLLLTEDGMAITELDSVPGGIGLTTWLYAAYEADLSNAPSTLKETPGGAGPEDPEGSSTEGGMDQHLSFLGSATRMRQGFAGIFGDSPSVHIIVSDESSTYRPEMEWLAKGLTGAEFEVRNPDFTAWRDGDAVYRFFELFDLKNIPAAWPAFEAARAKRIRLTPPPKPIFEEKLLLALLWNRHLRTFWRQELGGAFLDRLLRLVPYTWVMDPTPLPAHGAIPRLDLTDWHQLKALSQRERELILKVSGYSEEAWGARGVYLGSDLSSSEWSAAVDGALNSWPQSPYVLQNYSKPGLVPSAWFDFNQNAVTPMKGRVRLCPYYFVHGDGDQARPHLGGVLATICPADKKIIHGMRDAILAPCAQTARPSPAR